MTIENPAQTTVLTDAATALTPEEQFAADFAAGPAPQVDPAAADPAADAGAAVAEDPAAVAADPAAVAAGTQTTVAAEPTFEAMWAEGEQAPTTTPTADELIAQHVQAQASDADEFANVFNAKEAA